MVRSPGFPLGSGVCSDSVNSELAAAAQIPAAQVPAARNPVAESIQAAVPGSALAGRQVCDRPGGGAGLR